ncbi:MULTISPECIES: rhamnulose-1-phosphate aldolase [Blautia]|uniref:Rhamnulose-1-phosphate aldolase n=1 Tax=Blautia ammoniilytica TaxID=2981782 RepID=A0ABT2TP17_9FIRM|nr:MULTISPECIES: rhamnulose-1-phosphate aldolase [Blautia]MCU6763957.1 rhamnulose-1-phosphate aldolase [Blautia ammoniilytica]NSJ27220.1 rhamnulose-1-phosphate aldolase [Blautia glucerasea]SCH01783.1 Rhamnulose-1-phosphate aldolase [uncultured Blautia sp.]
MEMKKIRFFRDLIRMACDGWQLGWHEYHGGNITYRMNKQEAEQVQPFLTEDSPWVEMEEGFSVLGDSFFVVTGSGECFRDASEYPEEVFGIVKLNEKGTAYKVLWGLTGNGGKPTSEFMPHLFIHETKVQIGEEYNRIVYHAHPKKAIILTSILEHDSRKITRALWDMEPECPMTFPKGIGIIDWCVPGTVQLAQKTGELMKKYNVVLWSQHGILVSAADCNETIGIVHTVEKSSDMYLEIRKYKEEPVGVVTDEQYRKLAEVFHLDLPEEYI